MATIRGCTVIFPFTLIHGIFKSRQRRIGLMCNAVRTVIIVIGVYCIIQLVFFSVIYPYRQSVFVFAGAQRQIQLIYPLYRFAPADIRAVIVKSKKIDCRGIAEFIDKAAVIQ